MSDIPTVSYSSTFSSNFPYLTMSQKRKQHNCRKCFGHNVEAPLKGHKHCPYNKCVCKKCKIINTHRSDAAALANTLRNRRRENGEPIKLPQPQTLLENQYTVSGSGNFKLSQRLPSSFINETCPPAPNMQAAYNLDLYVNNYLNHAMHNPTNQQMSSSINIQADLLCFLLLA